VAHTRAHTHRVGGRGERETVVGKILGQVLLKERGGAGGVSWRTLPTVVWKLTQSAEGRERLEGGGADPIGDDTAI
jgi:hypothetical protein